MQSMADERLISPGIRDESMLAFNELIDRLGDIPLDQLLVNLVDNVTASALPHLAEQFHVTGLEGWALCATEADRRLLVKRALQLHRHKGTPWAVKEALASVGFGGATVAERLPQTWFDGAVYADGSVLYGSGANWAKFRILLDLGENRGITQAESALIVAVVAEWKNERSHLDRVEFRADTFDKADINDSQTTSAHAIASDILPWGIRYDGSLSYNNADVQAFNGSMTYGGTRLWSGWAATRTLHNNSWESGTQAAHVTASDQQKALLFYDGLADFNGFEDFGAAGAPIKDGRAKIVVRKHYLYDGKHTHNGATGYAVDMFYRGIHTIQEIRI
jgi:P2-related tail formation protein